jgi:hypothetical protein
MPTLTKQGGGLAANQSRHAAKMLFTSRKAADFITSVIFAG